MTKFYGILPALVTTFDSENRFDAKAFELLLERVYGANVHGVYVNGSTGEGLLQSIAQRKAVAEAAISNSPPDKQIIVHVGAAATSDAVELARHAARAGASAVSALPPMGIYSFDEVKAYYQAIAEASSVPLIAYYFPALNPIVKSPNEIVEICELPNVIGVKFTDYNLFALSVVKQSGATVFNGYDEVLVAGLMMGADGGIGTIYNLVPEMFVRLYDLTANNEWERARELQLQINELIKVVVRYPVFPATKAILKWAGVDGGSCLAPRRSLTATEETALRRELEQLSLANVLFN